MVQAMAVTPVSVIALVWKRMLSRTQLAMKPLYCISWVLPHSANDETLHDTMQKGKGKRNLLPKRNIQLPHKRQRHHEHHSASDHVWNRHVVLKGHFVNTLPSTERFVPFVGNRYTLKDGCEGVDQTSCDDYGSDDVDGNGEAPFTRGEDAGVEK